MCRRERPICFPRAAYISLAGEAMSGPVCAGCPPPPVSPSLDRPLTKDMYAAFDTPPVPHYHIPDDKQVAEALQRVLSTKRFVDSQRQLKRLVERELQGEDVYKVGEVRIRHAAIDSGLIDLAIHCRESGKTRTMVKCPVCTARLKRVRNMTVFGGTVTLGYHCSRCGYWTGIRHRIPTRYVFTRRG